MKLSDVVDSLETLAELGFWKDVLVELERFAGRARKMRDGGRRAFDALYETLASRAARLPAADDMRSLRFAFGFNHHAAELVEIRRGLAMLPSLAREACEPTETSACPFCGREDEHDVVKCWRETPTREHASRRDFVRSELRGGK